MSSLTGAGIPDFFNAVDDKRKEFETDYKPELERRIKERAEEEKTRELDKSMKDMKVASSSHRTTFQGK